MYQVRKKFNFWLEKEILWIDVGIDVLRDLKSFSSENSQRFRILTLFLTKCTVLSPNRLDRDFYASSTDEKYVGDITYIPTLEGWLYLDSY